MEKKSTFRTWRCPAGHVYESPLPVSAVLCGRCPSSVGAKRAMEPVLEEALAGK